MYERYKFLNRSQEPEETLEAFHTAQTAHAAKSASDTLEDELVTDLFIFKMRNNALQDTLTLETLTSEEVLKLLELKIKQSKQTTEAFRDLNTCTASAKQQSEFSQVKIKQEPIMAVRNRGQSNRKPNWHHFRRNQPEGRINSRASTEKRPCNRCGRSFTGGQLRKCPAMGKSSKNC